MILNSRSTFVLPDRTRTGQPVLSCIDLITVPCFPIRLIACIDGTNNRIEQNGTDAIISPSFSGNPLTRLNILIAASIAGERGSSASSLPDTKT